MGWAVEACGVHRLPQEALPFSGSSPYKLLKLTYDGPAQACGFCA